MLFVLGPTWSVTTATVSTPDVRMVRVDSGVITPTLTRSERLTQMSGQRPKLTVTPSNPGNGTATGTAQSMRPNVLPWTTISNYPQVIMDNSADAFHGKAYSVGGYNGSATVKSAYVYDPGSGNWLAIAAMADAREKPEAAFVNDKLYVVGGWSASGYPDDKLEIYDPDTNSWSTGASVPFALAAGAGVSLNGQFYVIGGCDNVSCGYDYAYRYDPGSNTWSSIAAYPEYTSWQACGSINGLIYCAGGVAADESQHAYVYDPVSNMWTPLANLPQTQWGMGYAAANGKLYISGGVNSGTVTKAGYAYNPASDSWTPIADSINAVYRGGSACGLYKIGGSTGNFNPVVSAEVFPGLAACGGFLVYLPLILKSYPAITPTPTPTPTVTPTPRPGTSTPTPTATPVNAVIPKDGSWSGPIISFSVTGGGTQIASMYLIMSGCNGGVTYYIFNSAAITNGAFTNTNGGNVIRGTFTSATTANGTYDVGWIYPCSGRRTGSWSASTP